MLDLVVRLVCLVDVDVVWSMLQLVFVVGDIYVVDLDIEWLVGFEYWFKCKDVFVVECKDGFLVGIYYFVKNQKGGGGYVCNCGFVMVQFVRGFGVVWFMLEYVLDMVWVVGYWVMQFNFVVVINI